MQSTDSGLHLTAASGRETAGAAMRPALNRLDSKPMEKTIIDEKLARQAAEYVRQQLGIQPRE